MAFYWSPLWSDSYEDLRGRPLRYLLITMLAEAQGPVTVRELIAGCEEEGVVFGGRASKIISDALRWELRSGRAHRLGRGVYAFGKVPRSTWRWICERVKQTRVWLSVDPARRRPSPEQLEKGTRHWDWQESSWVPGWPQWPTPNLNQT